MKTTTKLILDITKILNEHAEDRRRLSSAPFDFFDGEAEGFKQAMDIVARIATMG